MSKNSTATCTPCPPGCPPCDEPCPCPETLRTWRFEVVVPGSARYRVGSSPGAADGTRPSRRTRTVLCAVEGVPISDALGVGILSVTGGGEVWPPVDRTPRGRWTSQKERRRNDEEAVLTAPGFPPPTTLRRPSLDAEGRPRPDAPSPAELPPEERRRAELRRKSEEAEEARAEKIEKKAQLGGPKDAVGAARAFGERFSGVRDTEHAAGQAAEKTAMTATEAGIDAGRKQEERRYGVLGGEVSALSGLEDPQRGKEAVVQSAKSAAERLQTARRSEMQAFTELRSRRPDAPSGSTESERTTPGGAAPTAEFGPETAASAGSAPSVPVFGPDAAASGASPPAVVPEFGPETSSSSPSAGHVFGPVADVSVPGRAHWAEAAAQAPSGPVIRPGAVAGSASPVLSPAPRTAFGPVRPEDTTAFDPTAPDLRPSGSRVDSLDAWADRTEALAGSAGDPFADAASTPRGSGRGAGTQTSSEAAARTAAEAAVVLSYVAHGTDRRDPAVVSTVTAIHAELARLRGIHGERVTPSFTRSLERTLAQQLHQRAVEEWRESGRKGPRPRPGPFRRRAKELVGDVLAPPARPSADPPPPPEETTQHPGGDGGTRCPCPCCPPPSSGGDPARKEGKGGPGKDGKSPGVPGPPTGGGRGFGLSVVADPILLDDIRVTPIRSGGNLHQVRGGALPRLPDVRLRRDPFDLRAPGTVHQVDRSGLGSWIDTGGTRVSYSEATTAPAGGVAPVPQPAPSAGSPQGPQGPDAEAAAEAALEERVEAEMKRLQALFLELHPYDGAIRWRKIAEEVRAYLRTIFRLSVEVELRRLFERLGSPGARPYLRHVRKKTELLRDFAAWELSALLGSPEFKADGRAAVALATEAARLDEQAVELDAGPPGPAADRRRERHGAEQRELLHLLSESKWMKIYVAEGMSQPPFASFPEPVRRILDPRTRHPALQERDTHDMRGPASKLEELFRTRPPSKYDAGTAVAGIWGQMSGLQKIGLVASLTAAAAGAILMPKAATALALRLTSMGPWAGVFASSVYNAGFGAATGIAIDLSGQSLETNGFRDEGWSILRTAAAGAEGAIWGALFGALVPVQGKGAGGALLGAGERGPPKLVGVQPPGGVAEETVTLFRGMSKAEARALLRTGELTSKAQRAGLDVEQTLGRRLAHSLTSEGSPYVSLTSMPHIASEYSNYGVVMRITVPKSAVLKGLNVHQAEYLVPGGTKVIAAAQSQLPLPTFGATARWIGETGVVVGGSAYGGWELGTYLAGDQDDDR